MAMRDYPLYTLSEVDRLTRVMPGTASRWLQRSRTDGATFEDLIEVLIVGEFRKHGLLFRDIRRVVVECEKALRIPRPFTSWAFRTGGWRVIKETKMEFLRESVFDVAYQYGLPRWPCVRMVASWT
ncbi:MULTISPECIES: hypothetical protein [Alicyclobacillus]|uniref:Uncharacterized protein n=1 Tax=Alicyclobacillus acidocaldarius subsp. acidocaldarius (strain ATCC 27009 / DSM 446 / BCRC 14685 / JCM 5260 / KCTC 1825 / NBRC 15652 / NCIMB 11725 / NRRL B-14509 / 104-IA) TaxID=521098 RepID=C8WVP5_ALIAD|nr:MULTISPECIES: hypothetical protein [Alicyclobacillus]ACV58167.1 hypothetical protein Aaci_1134 [Alicyclobacillus acidocaldarius subsp. acidocaldarius DSM 446]